MSSCLRCFQQSYAKTVTKIARVPACYSHSKPHSILPLCLIMPPPLIGGEAIMLSDVCLSVAYIEPKSRTERPRKTEIDTEVAHVTRDSDTTFKVKRSKVKVTRPLCSPPCWRVRWAARWAWERVGRGKPLLRCRLLGGSRRFSAHGGGEGTRSYRGGRPPTAYFFCSR